MNSTEITTPQELADVLGVPLPHVAAKARPALHDMDRRWLAAAPLCVVATADAEGRCTASPKGDPAGDLAYVIDDRTIAIAERPGNKRADGYHNILANPEVGLLFIIPGRSDTLRIDGTATLVRDAPFLDQMVVKGHRPVMAMVVAIRQVFNHCAKAFMRSGAWEPETWGPGAVPGIAEITAAVMPAAGTREELETYYGPSYAARLYREGAQPPRCSGPR